MIVDILIRMHNALSTCNHRFCLLCEGGSRQTKEIIRINSDIDKIPEIIRIIRGHHADDYPANISMVILPQKNGQLG